MPDGEKMALKTLNGRLGILGGISILGTTGVVIPYSCSAWIHSIFRGVDVARAAGLDHVAGATGSTSEAAIQKLHGLPEIALIDMGDFVGGMLKYIRAHPVARVSVAGGVAKMTKLAQGMLDVHSKRGAPDLEVLADTALEAGGSEALAATHPRGQHGRRGVPDGERRKHRGSAIISPARPGTRRRRCCAMPTSRWRSWCSTAKARWSARRISGPVMRRRVP